MSKSNNGNTDNFADYQAFFDYFARSLEDVTKKVEVYSKSMDSLLKSTLEREVVIKNSSKMTTNEITKSVSNMVRTLKEMGIELGKEGKEFVKHLKNTAIAQSKKSDLSADKFKNDFINIGLTELITRAAKSGDNSFIKGFSKSDFAKNIADEINKRLGLAGIADSTIYKLTNFMRAQDKEKEKKTKGFIDDLVDGLAKSKFIGGALNDTFRLIGFLGGSWLSQFGQLGKILGAGFYIAMSTFGPIFTELIVKGIGNLLGNFLGKTFIGLIGSSVGGAVTAGLLTALPIAIAGAMLIKSGNETRKEADEDWKTGHKGRGALLRASAEGQTWGGRGLVAGGVATGAGVAAGLTGAALGGTAAGGIAAALTSLGAAIVTYVGLPILTIAAIVGVVGLAIKGIVSLWKHFHKDTTDHYKVMEDESKENKGFWQRFVDWFKNSKVAQILGLGGKGGENSSSKSISPTQQEMGENATIGKANQVIKGDSKAQLLEGKTNVKGYLDLKKMTKADWDRANTLEPVYGSMGEILNLGQMSQKRAKQVVEADIKAKGDKSFYEALDKDLVDKSQFNTDIPYAARGTSAKVRDFLQRMEKQGFDTSHVKITSAIGTLGSQAGMSPHKYTDSPGGHFSPYATTVDISALYTKDGRRLSVSDLKAAGLQDYYLYNKGKDHLTHEHISFGKLLRQQEIQEEKQKASSEQHSIEASAILKKLNAEEQQKLEKKGKEYGLSEKDMGDIYEKELAKYGVSSSSGKWIQDTGASSKELKVSWDPSGNPTIDNLTFMSNYANMGANQ